MDKHLSGKKSPSSSNAGATNNVNRESIAHALKQAGGNFAIHNLDDHLRDVASLAGCFGKAFGSEDWASVAGMWHDLGKYAEEFQRRIKSVSGYDPEAHLEGSVGRVDHSTAGAQYAMETFGVHGRILAYLIAGHHAGLPDWNSGETGGAALAVRLEDTSHLERSLKQPIPREILDQQKPKSQPIGKSVGFALWLRMLFSCLVDADFLDTEAFMSQEKSAGREGYPEIEALLMKFNKNMLEKCERAKPTEVNRIRAEILHQCREKASGKPGLYSLTVPTGGGKTLSSLAFALEHAVKHGKRRIIYVIPYTSIIEQTANIFREMFPDAVVEHHSNLDPDQESVKSRLATENWDAPVIVTTNVQFFESLFAARTSRCRKLHNIVNSVVVLDEAQLLPPEFLQPILSVINQLAKHYGVSFVLSTATQPALNSRSGFSWTFRGLDEVREIVDQPDSLYSTLERVTVELPKDFHQTESWDEIAARVRKPDTVLAVVNTRNDARELHRLMPKGTLHLSALMCGEHRSRVIEEIKCRLKNKEPVRVVSTQLVEAGVDVDFPVVFRALAGLDSIAQAAGRCNREGLLNRGRVVVFVPPKPPPIGHLRRAAETTVSLLHGRCEKPLVRDMFQRYFEQMYWKEPSLDKHDIEGLLMPEGQGNDQLKVQFRTAAQRFQMIDESGYRSVFVIYGDSPVLIGRLQKEGPERWLMRKLQRYSVSLPDYHFQNLLKAGDLREVYPGIYAQLDASLYSEALGLILADVLDAELLVV